MEHQGLWGKNASYHFVFTKQNRGKLDELTTLIARGQLRPHVGAVYSLPDTDPAHALLESPNKGFSGKEPDCSRATGLPGQRESSIQVFRIPRHSFAARRTTGFPVR